MSARENNGRYRTVSGRENLFVHVLIAHADSGFQRFRVELEMSTAHLRDISCNRSFAAAIDGG